MNLNRYFITIKNKKVLFMCSVSSWKDFCSFICNEPANPSNKLERCDIKRLFQSRIEELMHSLSTSNDLSLVNLKDRLVSDEENLYRLRKECDEVWAKTHIAHCEDDSQAKECSQEIRNEFTSIIEQQKQFADQIDNRIVKIGPLMQRTNESAISFLTGPQGCLKQGLQEIGVKDEQELTSLGLSTLVDILCAACAFGEADDSIVKTLKMFIDKKRTYQSQIIQSFLDKLQQKPKASTRKLFAPDSPLYHVKLGTDQYITSTEWNFLGLGTNKLMIQAIQDHLECAKKSLDTLALTILEEIVRDRMDQLLFHRNCEESTRRLLQEAPQSPEEWTKWGQQFSERYDARPSAVKKALKDVQLTDDQYVAILKVNPLAIDPLPNNIRQILSRYRFFELRMIVEKAPYLYPYFPVEKQRSLLEPFQITPALIAIFEDPSSWNQLLPQLTLEQLNQLLEASSLFSYMKMILGRDWEYIRNAIHTYSTDEFPHVQRFFCYGIDQWKFFIDPQYYDHGPEVFDRGLHGGEIEPGYMQSMKAGALWLMLRDPQFFTLSKSYKTLHQLVIGHQQGIHSSCRYSGKDFFIHPFLPRTNEFIRHLEEFYHEFKQRTIAVAIPEIEKFINQSSWSLDSLSIRVKMTFEPVPVEETIEYVDLFSNKANRFSLRGLSDEKKLLAIAEEHQCFECNHHYDDGNSRKHLLILEYRLVTNDLKPTRIDPNDSYLKTTKQWAEIIRQGQVH